MAVTPSFLQIFDDRWICEARVGSTDVRRHVQVELVMPRAHGLRRLPNHGRRCSDVEGRLPQSKYGLTTADFMVCGAESSVFMLVTSSGSFEPIRIEAFVTVDVSLDGFCVRVEQQLVRVAPQALLDHTDRTHDSRTVARVVFPADSYAIRRSSAPSFPSGLTVFLIEKTKLDFLGHLREEGRNSRRRRRSSHRVDTSIQV